MSEYKIIIHSKVHTHKTNDNDIAAILPDNYRW